MNIRQRAQSRRRKKELEAAIGHYNEAVKAFEAAANELLHIARESGTETVRLTAAVMEVRQLAKHALIKVEDLNGGEQNGKKE